MSQEVKTKNRGTSVMLGAAAVATVVIWQVPYGYQILYPFTLLATYAHEMGHGLTAILLGANFEQLVMFSDGSGYARWNGDVGRTARALISAGGLLGPSFAGAFLLILSKNPKSAPIILRVLAILMGLSALAWARSTFSVFFVLASAVLFFILSRFPTAAAFFVQLVGIQLCLAVFRDLDYMFSAGAVVDGELRPSDVAHIEEVLWLPYWVWGGLVALASFTVLAIGLYQAIKPPKARKASFS